MIIYSDKGTYKDVSYKAKDKKCAIKKFRQYHPGKHIKKLFKVK